MTAWLRKLLALVVVLACQGALAGSALAQSGQVGSELAAQLRSGTHVLLMRHAYAPGVGDPAGFVLERCETQRVLNDQGKEQALRTGKWLRAQGITQARVFSSPWCRCLQTAERLQLGPVQEEPSLASFFEAPQLAGARTEALQAFIAQSLRAAPQQPLVLVTHHVNIREYLSENIGSGDMVLAQVRPDGRVLGYRIYPSPSR